MKKLLFILFFPSFVFAQVANIRNNPLLSNATILLIDTARYSAFINSGHSLPVELILTNQSDKSYSEEVTAIADSGITGAYRRISITRGANGAPKYFSENDSIGLAGDKLTVNGRVISGALLQTSDKQFNYSQLPTQMTGSVNVGTISVNTNVPMVQHLYEATIGASLTLTANAGVGGQTVILDFITSGTVSRTITLGSGFRGGTITTGTTSGKHIAAEFFWNDQDNVWDLKWTPIAR